MKLKTLLETYFKQNGPTQLKNEKGEVIMVDYILTPDLIELFKDELEKCDEFRGSTIIPIKKIESGRPKRKVTGYDDDGSPIVEVSVETRNEEGEEIITSRLVSGFKTNQILKLHSISLTPEVIDPMDALKGKPGDIKILTVPDFETLLPLKKLIITWSPEQLQDDMLREFVEQMDKKREEEKKQEFTIKDDDDMKNAIDQAMDVASTIDRDEYKQFAFDTENRKIDQMLTEVKMVMMNRVSNESASKYQVKGKRAILIRCTVGSLDQTINSSIIEENGYVLL